MFQKRLPLLLVLGKTFYSWIKWMCRLAYLRSKKNTRSTRIPMRANFTGHSTKTILGFGLRKKWARYCLPEKLRSLDAAPLRINSMSSPQGKHGVFLKIADGELLLDSTREMYRIEGTNLSSLRRFEKRERTASSFIRSSAKRNQAILK